MKFKWSEKEWPLTYKDIKITGSQPLITNPAIIEEFQAHVYNGIVQDLSISVSEECGNLAESELLDVKASKASWELNWCCARVAVPTCEELENGTLIESTEEEYVPHLVYLSWDEFQLVWHAESLCDLTGRITDIIAKSFYNDTNRN